MLPDVVDFDGKDLRLHASTGLMTSGVPSLVKQAGSVFFSSGIPLELDFDRGNEEDTFLVKYQNSENSDISGMLKINIGTPHIPSSSHFADRDYELLEKVDAWCGFGWRTGTITKIFEGRRYNVFFRQGNEDRKLDHSEIRPHLEWVDGQTKAMNIPDHQEHLGEACEGSDNSEVVVRPESFGASEDNAKEKATISISLRNIMEQSSDCSENVLNNKKMKLLTNCDNSMPSCSSNMSTERDIVEVPLSVQLQKMPVKKTAKQEICVISPTTGVKGTKHSRKHVLVDQPSAKPDSLSGVEIVVTRKERAVKSAFSSSLHLTTVMERKVVDVATPNTNVCQGGLKVIEVPVIFGLQDEVMRRTFLKDVHQLSCDERLELIRDQKNNLIGLPGEQSMEFNHQTSGGSIQRRKRGRPLKFAVTNPKASVAGVSLETDCKIKEVDMAIAVASKNVTDDDQPLSMKFRGMHSSAGDSRMSSVKPATGWNETKERSAHRAVESSAKDAGNNGMPVDSLHLPFVRSPVWKTVESMEAFQIVPQQPHFHPLAECKEDYREGLAIGYMITFTSLLEKISLLQSEDPRSALESILESLLDLQKHGFDVTLLQGRVNELLSIKEAREELALQLKDSEREMREQADGKQELQGKINEIEKKIAELQQELTVANVVMEATDVEIARSTAKLDVLNLRINNVRHDFEDAATAPWKSP